jgi:hypothetical protein
MLRCDSSIYMFTKRVTVKRSLKCHVRFVPRNQATRMLGKARTLKMVLRPLWGKRIGDRVSGDDIVLRDGGERCLTNCMHFFIRVTRWNFLNVSY